MQNIFHFNRKFFKNRIHTEHNQQWSMICWFKKTKQKWSDLDYNSPSKRLFSVLIGVSEKLSPKWQPNSTSPIQILPRVNPTICYFLWLNLLCNQANCSLYKEAWLAWDVNAFIVHVSRTYSQKNAHPKIPPIIIFPPMLLLRKIMIHAHIFKYFYKIHQIQS